MVRRGPGLLAGLVTAMALALGDVGCSVSRAAVSDRPQPGAVSAEKRKTPDHAAPRDLRDETRPYGPFWVDGNSQAARQAALNPSFSVIAARPTALTVAAGPSDGLARLTSAVVEARKTHQTVIVQVYDIPHRDVGGGYSSGGAGSTDDYLRITRLVAGALRDAHAVVVLEPDSLGQIDQLSASQRAARYRLLNRAIDIYSRLSRADVYLDGANSGWTPAAEMAHRLLLAGVRRVQGFAVNVSNFYPTAAEAARAEQISRLTGGAHYIVDTSRNGGAEPGPHSSWCNPPDRRLGQTPTTDTGYPHADAFLWVKHPGESDGDCAPGQPPAGAWYEAYARQLVGLPPAG